MLVKGERTEKIYHANTGQGKVGATIFISIQVESEQKTIARYREVSVIMIETSGNQEGC